MTSRLLPLRACSAIVALAAAASPVSASRVAGRELACWIDHSAPPAGTDPKAAPNRSEITADFISPSTSLLLWQRSSPSSPAGLNRSGAACSITAESSSVKPRSGRGPGPRKEGWAAGQSEVSRIESARQNISIAKLANYAEAVGAKLDIRLDPVRPAN